MEGVTREYTVWCSTCSHWDQVSESRQAAAVSTWRREGWRFRKSGPLCPTCVKRQRAPIGGSR